jgi:monovalent cation:H+ antiporter, CPA1 family
VESESLFNDGVAAVLFSLVLVGIPTTDGEAITLTEAARAYCCSLSVAGYSSESPVRDGQSPSPGRASNHLIESTVTTIAAYGSFLVAEHFHFSGVLATVAAGLLVGNLAVLPKKESSRISLERRELILALWEFIAFIANSLVFLLIGLTVAGIPLDRLGGRQIDCNQVDRRSMRALPAGPDGVCNPVPNVILLCKPLRHQKTPGGQIVISFSYPV